MSVTQYNESIVAASAVRLLAATIDGKVQELGLAELLLFPSQGILEGPRDV